LRGANEKDTVFRFNQSVQDHGRDRKQIQRDFGGNFYGNLNCLKKYNFMKLLQTTIFWTRRSSFTHSPISRSFNIWMQKMPP
jgi:hypothetical protein